MAEKFISERNLKFLLYEMFDAESLLAYPRYADHSREVFEFDLSPVGGEFLTRFFHEKAMTGRQHSSL